MGGKRPDQYDIDPGEAGATGDERTSEAPRRAAESDADEEARLDQIAEESFPASDSPPGPISIGPKGKGPTNG